MKKALTIYSIALTILLLTACGEDRIEYRDVVHEVPATEEEVVLEDMSYEELLAYEAELKAELKELKADLKEVKKERTAAGAERIVICFKNRNKTIKVRYLAKWIKKGASEGECE